MKRSVGKALEGAIKEPEMAHPGGSSEGTSIFGNKVRRLIFCLLSYNPCQGINEISEGLEVSSTTIKWHLDKMVKAGYLVERRAGRRRLFWAEGQIPEAHAVIFSTLARKHSKELFVQMVKKPGLTQKEYAELLGMSHQGLASVAGRLADAGLASVMEEGVHTRYYPTRILVELSDENYEKSKAFKNFMIEKLKAEGESPGIRKSSSEHVILELGPKKARYILEFGLDPYSSVLDF